MKKQTLKKLILILIIFITILNCGIKKTSRKKKDIENFPDMIQTNYRHYIYKNAKRYLYAKIGHAEFYEKLKTIDCVDLEAKIYDSDGELTTIIHSDNGVVDKKEKKILFTGNVVFELLENETKLYSEEIELDYKNNKLITDKDVLIDKEDGSYIKATSMESDIKLEATNFENMDVKYFYDEDEDETTD